MKTISNHASAAKMIRKELKGNGIKATVRAKSYSGGSSINVVIKQDISPAIGKRIDDFCNQFTHGSFDGMQDMYVYSDRGNDYPKVSYVFIRIEYSDEIKQRAWDFAINYFGEEEGTPENFNDAGSFYHSGMHEYGNQLIGRFLNGVYPEFWSKEKPRQKAV